MTNFAKFLMAVGVVFLVLSVCMMQITEKGTAAYVMDGINIILGLLMIGAGAGFLFWKSRRK
ncbi:LPXTG cell wall anchor domain-containing protein [Flavonifractor sp. AGMB03687]|uniref:LPXTG cell wall anchor domain-containing protein n=1 Tax=Flavonifractor sp. AGMB03687 TaxID=2785133 RepID=UPI001ADED5F6|nr:LPXTG cell wall anchor domain-containing protein [Flavonifractor sp. AGMB03687]